MQILVPIFVFKFDTKISHPVTQSLMRLQTTGSQASNTSNNSPWTLYSLSVYSDDEQSGVFSMETGFDDDDQGISTIYTVDQLFASLKSNYY